MPVRSSTRATALWNSNQSVALARHLTMLAMVLAEAETSFACVGAHVQSKVSVAT